jgi:hypothetical protein
MAKEQMNENYELHDENKLTFMEGRNAMNRWLIHKNEERAVP